MIGQTSPDCYPTVETKHSDKDVFHKANNNLPDTIAVVGVVVGVVPGICGSLCFCGSIKVKLTTKIDKYPYEYIYLTTGCVDLSSKCHKKICNIKVSKLLETTNGCVYKGLTNKFDTTEIPFYIISSEDLTLMQLPQAKINNCR